MKLALYEFDHAARITLTPETLHEAALLARISMNSTARQKAPTLNAFKGDESGEGSFQMEIYFEKKSKTKVGIK